MKIKEVKPENTKTFKTKKTIDNKGDWKWWLAKTDKELLTQTLSVATYLKDSQGPRLRQAAIFARLYGNQSLYNFAGMSMMKMDTASGLPFDRPTFNLVQSCVDTLVSRIGQNKPMPTFLTDGSKYKQRSGAKKATSFIAGEFYQTKAHEKTSIMLRDALVEGMGILKIVETSDHKVGLERTLLTELLVDPNDGIYGAPRTIYQTRLVDREVAMDMLPKAKGIIKYADTAYPDNSGDSSKTVSDQILLVEGWHLPSGKDSEDGRHVIACSAGIILDEKKWNKDKFPFIFLPYSDRLLGFWPQGLAEQLMGTQIEINSLLYTISRAIKLVGIPRVFEEMGSKVMAASHNNDLGVIIKYRGTKPTYEVAPCNAPELYQHLERLINFGYQQAGVSAMQAGAQKPQGFASGEAQRVYDDISTDRFASLSKKYDNIHIELAYAILDKAIDIAKEQGEYATVYPAKDGVEEIDLPEMDFVENPFIIQCFNQSSLPRDPAGRMQKVTEMIQSGMVSIQEGRRLLDYPDISQIEKNANAREERIYKVLDQIVDDGMYSPPDPFTDLELANKIIVEYINVYDMTDLEEEKMQMLRTYFSQIQALKTEATASVAPQPGAAPANAPQAAPMPLPQSPLVPNNNGGIPV